MAMRITALLAALVLSLALVACGKTDGDADPQPKPSPRGEPIGQPVTAQIGTDGGEVRSADGLLTLVIPAGALKAPTEVGVQQLKNTAPYGRGPAYRIVPDDLELAEPMLLQFLDQAAGHAVAWQDTKDVWRAVPQVATARALASTTASTTATGTATTQPGTATTTAGDFASFEAFRLVPSEADLQPGQRLELTVETCARVNVDHLAELLETCRPLTLAPLIKDASVNGVIGGNAETGTVEQQAGKATLTYSAPATQPASNPVAVSVRISMLSQAVNLLVSNLNIAGTTNNYDLVQFDGEDLPSDWLPREPWNNPERVTGGRLVLGEQGTYSLRLEWVEDRGNGQTLAQFMQDAGNYEKGPDNRIEFTSLGDYTYLGTAQGGSVTVHEFPLYTSNTSVVAELTFGN